MTAVEFLHSEYMKIFGELNPSTGKLVEIAYALEQAKEMEKEQHDKTAEEWWKEGAHYMESAGRAKWESFEQYYNETFK